GHMPDRLALGPHAVLLGPEMTIGVDLHLDAAIAENALGDDGHHINAVNFRGNDEWRRFVVRIRRAGADGGDEHIGAAQELTVPSSARVERHHPTALIDRATQKNMRIGAHDPAILVCIAVASAGHARLDVAHHRTGVAAHLPVAGYLVGTDDLGLAHRCIALM